MFPTFNLYSTSLLILTSQGLIFSYLLLKSYKKHQQPSDLLLFLILIITCYHQTTYTLGFMSWYDTYRTTKINYFLVDLSFALAPLIYYYIRSVVSPAFKWQEMKFWHFIPMTVYLAAKIFILFYDRSLPNFQEVQNGYLVLNFEQKYLNPLVFLLKMFQMLLYLAFSFQAMYAFREKIKHYFANTYKLELRWLQNFLIAYSFLYLFNSIQTIVNEVIVDLSWIQEWWYYLLSGVAIIYVGINGYFTNLTELQNVDFSSFQPTATRKQSNRSTSDPQLEKRKEALLAFMKNDKPFLDPDLSLISLAQTIAWTREELSDTINQAFDTRFNDFVNQYRINEIKRLIDEGKNKTHSLLGIAFEAGFNSKATFNRAFKKLENQSPSQYLESLV